MGEQGSALPTFLFTDVEGSTRLLRRLGSAYLAEQGEHQRLVREAIGAYGGREVDTQGDSFFAVFERPRDAILAAVAAQRALAVHPWRHGAELRIRVGIHTGPAEVAGERYVGLSVHRAARICAAGHGGQILVSGTTVAIVEDAGSEFPGIELRELEPAWLKDFEQPVRLYQASAVGLREDFPPLRAPDATPPTVEQDARWAGEAEPGPSRAPRKRFTAAIVGGTERSGRWRIGKWHVALVLLGDADLDLREAELEGVAASILVFVLFGNIDLYVSSSVEVDLRGLSLIGHRRAWGHDQAAVGRTPRVRITVLSLFGTVDLWRVPMALARRPHTEVIEALSRRASGSNG